MATGAERNVLATRPATRAVLLRPGNVARAAAAAALLLPGAQAFMAKAIVPLGYRVMSPDLAGLLPYIPTLLLAASFAYRVLYQKTCTFALTDERLIVRYGLLLRVEDEVELYRVVDVTQTVGIFQRMLGVGNVHVSSTDRTGGVVLPLIRHPSAVRNAIRTEAERCKNRRGAVRILE